jgi:hypothetical protein
MIALPYPLSGYVRVLADLLGRSDARAGSRRSQAVQTGFVRRLRNLPRSCYALCCNLRKNGVPAEIPERFARSPAARFSDVVRTFSRYSCQAPLFALGEVALPADVPCTSTRARMRLLGRFAIRPQKSRASSAAAPPESCVVPPPLGRLTRARLERPSPCVRQFSASGPGVNNRVIEGPGIDLTEDTR